MKLHSDKTIRAIDLGLDLRTEGLPFKLIVDGGIAAIEYDGPDGKPAVAKGTIDQIAKELDKNGYGPIQIPNRNGDSKIWFFDGKYHVETKANGKTEDWQKFASLEEALRLVTQTTEEPS